MIVVADATPLRYLLLIEKVDLLALFYGQVLIPPAVVKELMREQTPPSGREWMTAPPEWLKVHSPLGDPVEFPAALGAGECAAITLAEEIHADLLLVDDWAARREAERRKLPIQGTLGLLRFAAQADLVDLPDAIVGLRGIGFRVSGELVQSLLREGARRRRK